MAATDRSRAAWSRSRAGDVRQAAHWRPAARASSAGSISTSSGVRADTLGAGLAADAGQANVAIGTAGGGAGAGCASAIRIAAPVGAIGALRRSDETRTHC
jgi:hypothetical protein